VSLFETCLPSVTAPARGSRGWPDQKPGRRRRDVATRHSRATREWSRWFTPHSWRAWSGGACHQQRVRGWRRYAQGVTYRRRGVADRCRAGDPDRHRWAMEGTGSFGRALTTYLREAGEAVAAIDRPARPTRRREAWWDQRCRLSDVRLAPTGARLRTTPRQAVAHGATDIASQATARRVRALEAEAEDHASDITFLVAPLAPTLGGGLRSTRRSDAHPGGLEADHTASPQSLRRRARALRAAADRAGAYHAPCRNAPVCRAHAPFHRHRSI